MDVWRDYAARQKETERMKTTGTDIDSLMPSMTRFGSANRAEKKKDLIDRLLAYFDRFFGIGAVD